MQLAHHKYTPSFKMDPQIAMTLGKILVGFLEELLSPYKAHTEDKLLASAHLLKQ